KLLVPQCVTGDKDVHLAQAQELWSTARDEPVKLRMEASGLGSEPPMTIHQMFMSTVQKYGDYPALRAKKDGIWLTLTYKEYYQHARAAAKSFLKVGLHTFSSLKMNFKSSQKYFLQCMKCIVT
uniref:Uncharacterized protein n=1 Tax=Cyprinus carpio TaxID=7962 RepID=A0A8C2FDW0_CYPCA